MSEWLELAKRCEAAKGPDREIDAAIMAALFAAASSCDVFAEKDGAVVSYPHAGGKRIDASPIYTASLDAITALIERELPESGHGYTVHDVREKQAVAHVCVDYDADPCGASAATPALALCAAFCRAMAERGE
jgi:hypothetical protein